MLYTGTPDVEAQMLLAHPEAHDDRDDGSRMMAVELSADEIGTVDTDAVIER